MAVHRPAARVVCVDVDSRLLLLQWRDPSDGAVFWEPPGGGIEAGESPFDAACRELFEETGIARECVHPRSIEVERDVWWNGQHFTGPEQFFVARVVEAVATPQRLGSDEGANLVEHRWFNWSDVCGLEERVEPPNLRSVLVELLPDGPWARATP